MSYDPEWKEKTTKKVIDERDTYRDLCAELLDSLKEYMGAVELMNLAMKDGINVHGAISGIAGAEENAFQSITKAEAILGEKNENKTST